MIGQLDDTWPKGARNLEPDHVRSLFFGDFANPDSNLRNYDEITDEVGLKTTMDSYLEEYNQMSTAPMSLVNRVLDIFAGSSWGYLLLSRVLL